MRKILFSVLVLSAMTAVTGCLKDKDFEDQKYGIVIKEEKGVTFTQAAKSPVVVGINSQTDPQTVSGPLLALNAEKPPTSPVTVTLTLNSALVTAAGITPLQPTDFTVNTLTVTFAPGEITSDVVKITLPNTSGLDPNISYGIGFTISTADQGYKIAANQKNVVIAFNIKNKYDGVYTLKGKHNRSPYNFPYETIMHLVTEGPTSVSYYWPDVGDVGHPIGTGPDPLNDISWYGNSIAPVLVFDPTTNNITDVFNATGSPPIVPHSGGGLQGRWDPITKTVYAYFYYYTGAGQDFSNRGWSDTLIYKGPR